MAKPQGGGDSDGGAENGADPRLLRAVRLAVRRDRHRRGRALRRASIPTRRIPPARRSAPRAGPRPSSSITATACSIPLKRTRPKGDPDPGWQRIGWDEALELTASRLRRLAAERGPRASYSAWSPPRPRRSDDSMAWIERLMRAFGSPNLVRRWSCAAGAASSPRLHLRRAGRSGTLPCPTSSTPAASCSGATTPTSPGSPTRRPTVGGAQARRTPDRGRPPPRRAGRARRTRGCRCGRAPTARSPWGSLTS